MKTVAESYWETFERTLDDQVTTVIHRIGVPTKGEIEELTKKVEQLTASIEKLRAKPSAAKKAPATKKATS
jgi:poly(hydroxyalkanoate) granule-associated protein